MSRTDRLPYVVLGLAMAASALFLMWTSRGFTFFNDEIGWYSRAGYDPGMLLLAHNTHLIAVPRLVYTVSLDLFGPEYLPLRVVSVVGVLLCGGLLFELARRRIGPVAALAPAIVVLFFGTAWNVVVSPIGIPFVYATALGLGALVALERGGRRGDVAACVLTVASLASHSIGISFLVGVAVSVLLRLDRAKRLWVFAVPLALYAIWFLLRPGSPSGGGSLADASNVLGLPRFIFSSLGAVLTAITGLNFVSDPTVAAGFNRAPTFGWALLPVLALAGLLAFALRLRRGGLSPGVWVFLAVLLTFWVSIGLSAGDGRGPTTARYLFPGAVMVLLVAVESVRGVRLSRVAVAALFAVAAVSVSVNVLHGLDARRFLAAYAANIKPTLAMIELAGADGSPGFRPGEDAPGASPRQVGVPASIYLRGAARWGSIAATMDEVRRAPPVVRNRADVVLARSLALETAEAPAGVTPRECTTLSRSGRDPFTRVTLPPGGGILRILEGEGGEVGLRRFGGAFAASAGNLLPGGRTLLEVPRDAAPERWQAAVAAERVEICAAPTAAENVQRYCEVARRLEQPRRRGPGETRALLAQLAQLAPPEIQDDTRVVLGALIGASRDPAAAREAQRRIEAFRARRCET